ncbi:VWA domain-containing protein [Streptomyces palmae]|uniref:VWA domain-containing protein n=1 Tax=Streptomyces palmae TaxID=1701085 RepID=A0A4Z0H865_9ACTN|nr:VWA domain-containing protein [Streptomyces palmae]TGB11807.1 VWA domain-containing protein [Streptomyces palmae]
MPGRAPDPERSRALLVGIPEVLEGGFDRLDYVDANLEALRDALTRPPNGILAADRVTVLRSPSRAQWHHELRKAADQTGDLLLCYFAGHGYRHALTNVLHLMTRDADLDGDLHGTALAWAEILAAARRPTVRRALFLLDCCFSGMAAQKHGGGELGHYILASAAPTRTQPATALPNGRSPFTDAIVTEMLRGGPAESGGLTMHTLFNRLHERMRDWPTPHVTDGWGPRNGSGGDGPDILLSRTVTAGSPKTGAPGGAATGPKAADGTVPSGSALSGRDPSGRDPSGTDVDGSAPSGTDLSGGGPRRTDPSGTDPSGGGPRRTDPNGKDPSGTGWDGAGSGGAVPEGGGSDGVVPDGPGDPAPDDAAPDHEGSPPSPSGASDSGQVRRLARTVRRWCGRHLRATAGIGAALAVLVAGGAYLLRDGGEARGACPPPVQLRLLASTENRAAVTRAVAAYTASEANRRRLDSADHAPADCRRTNITVFDAGAGDIVEAFGATRAWAGRPASATTDGCRPADGSTDSAAERGANCREPLQDIGPQPDLLALGSSAELARVQDRAEHARGPAAIVPLGPGGYSPLVLAVPARLEDRLRQHGAQRTGTSWTQLLDALDAVRAEDRKGGALPLLRPDPASSDIGLLHTLGLYEARDGVLDGGRARDPRWAERRVDGHHPAAPDAGTLLCELAGGYGGQPALGTAALLVDERTVADYNLGRPGGVCDLRKPVDDGERLLAYYPSGVPALDLPFAEVRWDGARDGRQRTAAVRQFYAWITGAGRDSFLHGALRGVTAERQPRPADGAAWHDPAESGVLAEAEVVTRRPDPATAVRTAADYADTLAPGQVLFLVDTSGSMVTGGKQAMLDSALRHALNALGPQDRYGVWSYPGSASDPASARVEVGLGTPGSDPGPARRWLDSLTLDGTRPGAAVYEVLQEAVRATRGEKHAVIVLITDGDDRPEGDPAGDDYQRWADTKDRTGTPDVLVLSTRALGCAEVETQVFANGPAPDCFAGRPEDAARRLTDRLGDYVRGGGTR